jgi:hypothetical protein
MKIGEITYIQKLVQIDMISNVAEILVFYFPCKRKAENGNTVLMFVSPAKRGTDCSVSSCNYKQNKNTTGWRVGTYYLGENSETINLLTPGLFTDVLKGSGPTHGIERQCDW